jgi:hypothetical protein
MSFLDLNYGNAADDAANPFMSDIVIDDVADTAEASPIASAIEDLTADNSAKAPNVEPGKPSDDSPETSEPEKIAETGDDTGKEPDEAAAAEKPTEDKPAEDKPAEAAEVKEPTIPTGEEFREAHRREMPKKIAEAVGAFLDEGRAAQIRVNELETQVSEVNNLVNEFGGTEVLTEYKPLHEFLADIPPSFEDTDAALEYWGKADQVWETLTSQNDTAAVQLATVGGLQLINHVPQVHDTFLEAMFAEDLKLRTEALGDNDQEDIQNYEISRSRILDLIRLDALKFLPENVADFNDDFRLREGDAAAAAAATAGDGEKQPASDDSKTKTPNGDKPTAQANDSLADFEREFEEVLPKKIETALQKGNFQDNENIKFLIANAAENIVRKSENYKTVSDYLKAGNTYKTDGKVSMPIKNQSSRIQNTIALAAEDLVLKLLNGYKLPAAPPAEEIPPTPPVQTDRAPISQPQNAASGEKRYSSEYVERRKAELNGGLG